MFGVSTSLFSVQDNNEQAKEEGKDIVVSTTHEIGTRCITPDLEKDRHYLDTTSDDENDPMIFRGVFWVTSYPFVFTKSDLVSDKIKFCVISLICPQLNVDPDQVPLSHIPLSLVQEAFEGKPIQVFREDRVFELEFQEDGGLLKSKLLDFISRDIKTKERMLDDSDEDWFKQSV